MGNRMEAGLADKGDVKDWSQTRNELKEEIRALIEEKEKLEKSQCSCKKTEPGK